MKCPECGGEDDSSKHQMTCVSLKICQVREHVGIEKVIQKIGMNQPLMPDPELGQDVAFLAHVITTLTAENVRQRSENTALHNEVVTSNLQVESYRKALEIVRSAAHQDEWFDKPGLLFQVWCKIGEVLEEKPEKQDKRCGSLRPEYDWCRLEPGHDGPHEPEKQERQPLAAVGRSPRYQCGQCALWVFTAVDLEKHTEKEHRS